jgi:hypothetical protein
LIWFPYNVLTKDIICSSLIPWLCSLTKAMSRPCQVHIFAAIIYPTLSSGDLITGILSA